MFLSVFLIAYRLKTHWIQLLFFNDGIYDGKWDEVDSFSCYHPCFPHFIYSYMTIYLLSFNDFFFEDC